MDDYKHLIPFVSGFLSYHDNNEDSSDNNKNGKHANIPALFELLERFNINEKELGDVFIITMNNYQGANLTTRIAVAIFHRWLSNHYFGAANNCVVKAVWESHNDRWVFDVKYLGGDIVRIVNSADIDALINHKLS
jgi:hypothetical protein